MTTEHSPNTLFLFVCANESNAKFDWVRIGEALGLKMGTASMRWQRLRTALEKEGLPSRISASTLIDDMTVFLYNCIRHSTVKLDFGAIGNATGLKSGTAAMRYRRLCIRIKMHEAKQAAGEGATTVTAATPVKTAKPPTEPNHGRKRKNKTTEGETEAGDGPAAAPAKKAKKTKKVQKIEADSEQADKEQK
ncbi:hypothetical protein DV735_g1371, partial [Chaetothyriales sp. CBS 134920]